MPAACCNWAISRTGSASPLVQEHDRRHRRGRGERHRVQRVGPGRRGRAAGGHGEPEHHPVQLDRRERRAGDQLRQRADAEPRPGYSRAERLSELPGAVARPGQRGRHDGRTGRSSRAPNTTYLVQFFSSPQPDPSGYGQGKTFLGSMNVQTDSKGNASFTTGLPPAGAAGMFLSATATDPDGNTSEFSGDVAVQGQINLVLDRHRDPQPGPRRRRPDLHADRHQPGDGRRPQRHPPGPAPLGRVARSR